MTNQNRDPKNEDGYPGVKLPREKMSATPARTGLEKGNCWGRVGDPLPVSPSPPPPLPPPHHQLHTKQR